MIDIVLLQINIFKLFLFNNLELEYDNQKQNTYRKN
jgi:hypothetical protein